MTSKERRAEKRPREERNERRRQAKLARRSRLGLRSSCQGCDRCSAIKARETWIVLRDPSVPVDQEQGTSSVIPAKVYRRARDSSFKGVVSVKRREARSVAKQEDGLYLDQSRMVYWSDGSQRVGLGCGVGVAYCSPTGIWTARSWGLREFTTPTDLEVYAIAKALEIAWETCRKIVAEHRPSSVFIYSDCLGALDYFNRFRWTMDSRHKLAFEDCLIRPGIVAAEELSAIEITVELRWVPGHTDILGNEMADMAARRGAASAWGDKNAQELMTEYPLLLHPAGWPEEGL